MKPTHNTCLRTACFLLTMTATLVAYAQTAGFAPASLQEFRDRVAGSRIIVTSGRAARAAHVYARRYPSR